MKKALLLFSVLFCSILTFAQQSLQVGIFGGPQSTWLFNKNDSDDPNKYTNGWRGFGGVSVDFHFTGQAGIGLEFEYSKQGQNYTDQSGTIAYRYVVDYFKIPLVLNFNTNPDKVVMFVGKFGPYIGIATGADAKATGVSEDISSYFQKANVGAILGLAIGFNIKKVVVITAGLRLDGQFNDALVTITDPASPAAGDGPFTTYNGSTHAFDPVRQRTWSVAGGIEIGAKYIIPVGKKSHSSYHRR